MPRTQTVWMAHLVGVALFAVAVAGIFPEPVSAGPVARGAGWGALSGAVIGGVVGGRPLAGAAVGAATGAIVGSVHKEQVKRRRY